MKKLLIFLLIAVATQATAFGQERIIFSRFTDDYWQIWAMSPDGSRQTQLTDSKIDKRNPVCMENGTSILFRTNNGKLMINNLATKTEREILSQYDRINNPFYCQERKELLFVRFDPRAIDISDIWRSDLKGENPRIITKDKILKYQPAFDSSCDQVAFVKADKTKPSHHIWTMSADGKDLRQITEGNGFDVLPSFLPDGKNLVFSSNRDGKDYELYMVSLADKKIVPLTDNDALDTSPAAFLDQNLLTFVSSLSGNQQIWTMDLEDKSVTRLTGGDNESVDPHWCIMSDDE